MCRLALMNRSAVSLLSVTNLALLFGDLEASFGGDGHGIAGLWMSTGKVKIHKSLLLTPQKAANRAFAYRSQGADWFLFHTRFATSAAKTSRHCYPFQCGDLVLAHNGHAWMWDELGSVLGISDSECITKVWSRLGLPISSLQDQNGVFLGFSAGMPFVVKGKVADRLEISTHKRTGAILFASTVSDALRYVFDQTTEVGCVVWDGHLSDIEHIMSKRVSTFPHRAATTIQEELQSSSSQLAKLRVWYQSVERTDE